VGGIGSDTVLIGRRHVVAVWLCQAGEHRPHVHGDGEAQGLQANRPHERVEQGEAVPLSLALAFEAGALLWHWRWKNPTL
jgi:hypothetical protein